MAQCQSCQQPIPDGASHCPRCGAEQAPATDDSKSTVFGYAANPEELLQPPQAQAPAPAAAPPAASAPPMAAAPPMGAPPAGAPVHAPPAAAPPAAAPPVAAAPVPGAPMATAPVPGAPMATAPVPGAPMATAPVPGAPATAAPPMGAPPVGAPSAAPPAAAPAPMAVEKKKGGALWLVLIIIGMVLGTGALITGIYGMVETKPNFKYARARYILGGSYRSGRRGRLTRLLTELRYKSNKRALQAQAFTGWILGLIGLVFGILGLLIGKRKLGIAPIAINGLAFILAFVLFPW